MRPASSTMRRSMRAIVDRRWAIAITVLPSIRPSSCSWIASSTSLSRAEVASSSTRMGAFFNATRDRDALALAARELDAALAHVRFVARALFPVAQLGDELVRVGLARRGLDLRVARFGAAVADVFRDRAVQEGGVLRHHADRRAQAFLRDLAQVLAVDADAALLEVVKAQQ